MAKKGDSRTEAKDASMVEKEVVVLRKLNAKLIDELAMLRKQHDLDSISCQMQAAADAYGNGIEPPMAATDVPGGADGVLQVPFTKSGGQRQRSKELLPLDQESSLLNGHPFRWGSAECLAHHQDGLPSIPNGNDADCPTCDLNIRLDNFRKQLGDITGRLENWGQNGQDAWKRILSLEARLKDIIPMDSSALGRKELRHLKGAKVQELVGMLKSLSAEIRTCQHSLLDDGKATVENVRADLVEVLLGIDTLMAQRRHEVQSLNVSSQRIQELEALLECVKQEKRAAIVESGELHDQAGNQTSELSKNSAMSKTDHFEVVPDTIGLQVESSKLQQALNEAQDENGDLRLQISRLQKENENMVHKIADLEFVNQQLKIQKSDAEEDEKVHSGLRCQDETDVLKQNTDEKKNTTEMSGVPTIEESDAADLHAMTEMSEPGKEISATGLTCDKGGAVRSALQGELLYFNEELSKYKAQTTALRDELCKMENNYETALMGKNDMKSELSIAHKSLKNALQCLRGLEHEMQGLLGVRNELQNLSNVVNSHFAKTKIALDSNNDAQHSSQARELGPEVAHQVQAGVASKQENTGNPGGSNWYIWSAIGFGGGLVVATCIARALQK